MQVGGVAGLNRVTEVDSQALAHPEAEELAMLVQRAPWGGRAPTPAKAGAADLCQYFLTVRVGRLPRTICVDDLTMDDATSALVAFVRAHGEPPRPRRRRTSR